MEAPSSKFPPPLRDRRDERRPLPAALTGRTLAEGAQAALDTLDAVGGAEDRSIYSQRLNDALFPLLLVPAVGVRCSGTGCGPHGAGLGWWALLPGAAIVVATKKRARADRRSGGFWDLDDSSDEPGRYPGWVSQAMAESGRIVISEGGSGGSQNASGVPLRLTFTCPRCGAEYPTTNTFRLRRYLEHLASRTSGSLYL